jgi:hypothetical protein
MGKEFHPSEYKLQSNDNNGEIYHPNRQNILDDTYGTNEQNKRASASYSLNESYVFSLDVPSGSSDLAGSYITPSTPPPSLISQNRSHSQSITNNPYISRLLNENLQNPIEQEIYSRLWFTYRKDFEPLGKKYTSDCGWGCMLRSAQMLVAQALLVNNFGTEWSLYKSLKTQKDCNLYKEIISLFNDRPSRSCPFGIHRLLEIADKKLNDSNQATRAGTWFGPSSVCLLMKYALSESTNETHLLNKLRIYVAQDCTIFKQDVIDLCCKNDTNNNFMPCIILISVRLGGEELNEIYVDTLKAYFRMDLCIGMIGGKPKHSLYFIGYQGDKVLYLDPHLCQPTTLVYSSSSVSSPSNNDTNTQMNKLLDTSIESACSYDDAAFSPPLTASFSLSSWSDYDSFDNTSFHCTKPYKAPFNKLDPSLAIGFLCRSLNDLNRLYDFAKSTSSSDLQPIFAVSEGTFEQSELNYQSICLDDNKVVSMASSKPPIKKEMTSLFHEQITDKATHQTNNRIKYLSTHGLQATNKNEEQNKNSISSYLSNKIAQSKFLSNHNRSASSSGARDILRPKSTTKNKTKPDSDDFILI